MSLHSYFGTVTQQSPRLHMDDLWAADQSAVGSGVMRRGAQHGSECFNRKRVLAQALELFLPCFDLCSSTTNRSCSETRWSLAASLNTPARKCPCLTRKLALLLQCWAMLGCFELFCLGEGGWACKCQGACSFGLWVALHVPEILLESPLAASS